MNKSANSSGSTPASNQSANAAAGRSKFTSRNLNKLTKAPTSNQQKSIDLRYAAGGRLLVLGKKPGEAGGLPTAPAAGNSRVATPAPLNTSSLRRENNGNDIGVSLVNRGASSGASWGNKVTSQTDAKDSEKSDSSQATGVWKDKDDDAKDRPKLPPKRSDSKWGDDDDSPLDNEQFPGLQDSLKERPPANDKDQLRPRGGGRDAEDGYRSWKRDPPPRDMEASDARDWRGGPPLQYDPSYSERGSYDRPAYHHGGYGDQYSKDYGIAERGPPPPPPGPPPYDDRYQSSDSRFGRGYSPPPPDHGGHGGRFDFQPQPQQGQYDWDPRRGPPPSHDYYSHQRGAGRGSSHERGGGYDRDDGGYRDYGRDSSNRYHSGGYTPRSRDWKHYHGEEGDQRGGYRPTGGGYDHRGSLQKGPPGGGGGWRERMSARGRGAGGFVDQHQPYPSPKTLGGGGRLGGATLQQPPPPSRDYVGGGGPSHFAGGGTQAVGPGGPPVGPGQQPPPPPPPPLPPGAGPAGSQKEEGDLDKTAMQAALKARQQREEAERQRAEKMAILKAREERNRLEEQRRLSVRSEESGGDSLPPSGSGPPDQRPAGGQSLAKRKPGQHAKELGADSQPLLEIRPGEDQQAYMRRLAAYKVQLRREEDERLEAQRREGARRQLEALEARQRERQRRLSSMEQQPSDPPHPGSDSKRHQEEEQMSLEQSAKTQQQRETATAPVESKVANDSEAQPSAPQDSPTVDPPIQDLDTPTSPLKMPLPANDPYTGSPLIMFGSILPSPLRGLDDSEKEDEHDFTLPQASTDSATTSTPTKPLPAQQQPAPSPPPQQQPPPPPSASPAPSSIPQQPTHPAQSGSGPALQSAPVSAPPVPQESGAETRPSMPGTPGQPTRHSQTPSPSFYDSSRPFSSLFGAPRPPPEKLTAAQQFAPVQLNNEFNSEGGPAMQPPVPTGPRQLYDYRNDKMIEVRGQQGRRQNNIEEDQLNTLPHHPSQSRSTTVPSSIMNREKNNQITPRGRKPADDNRQRDEMIKRRREQKDRKKITEKQSKEAAKREKERAEEAQRRREARAKERAERGPRTPGVLFRFHEDGEIVNADLPLEEQAQMAQWKREAEERKERAAAKRAKAKAQRDAEAQRRAEEAAKARDEEEKAEERARLKEARRERKKAKKSGTIEFDSNDEGTGFAEGEPGTANSEPPPMVAGVVVVDTQEGIDQGDEWSGDVFTEVKSSRTRRQERKEAKEKEEKEAAQRKAAEVAVARRQQKKEAREKARAEKETKKKAAEEAARKKREQEKAEKEQRERDQAMAEAQNKALAEARAAVAAVPPALATVVRQGMSLPDSSSQGVLESSLSQPTLGATIGSFLGGFGSSNGGFSAVEPLADKAGTGNGAKFSEAVARPPSGGDRGEETKATTALRLEDHARSSSPPRSRSGTGTPVTVETTQPSQIEEKPSTPPAAREPDVSLPAASDASRQSEEPATVQTEAPSTSVDKDSTAQVSLGDSKSREMKSVSLSPGTPSFLPSSAGSTLFVPTVHQLPAQAAQANPYLPQSAAAAAAAAAAQHTHTAAPAQPPAPGQLHTFGSLTAGGLFIPGLSNMPQAASTHLSGLAGTATGIPLAHSHTASGMSHVSTNHRGLAIPATWNAQAAAAVQQASSKLAAGLRSEWTPQQGLTHSHAPTPIPAPRAGASAHSHTGGSSSSHVTGGARAALVPPSHGVASQERTAGAAGTQLHQWGTMSLLQSTAHNPLLAQQATSTGSDRSDLQGMQAFAYMGGTASQSAQGTAPTRAGTGSALYSASSIGDGAMSYQANIHSHSTYPAHQDAQTLFLPSDQASAAASSHWGGSFAQQPGAAAALAATGMSAAAAASTLQNFYNLQQQQQSQHGGQSAVGAQAAAAPSLHPQATLHSQPSTAAAGVATYQQLRHAQSQTQKWESVTTSMADTHPRGHLSSVGGTVNQVGTGSRVGQLPPAFTPAGQQSQYAQSLGVMKSGMNRQANSQTQLSTSQAQGHGSSTAKLSAGTLPRQPHSSQSQGGWPNLGSFAQSQSSSIRIDQSFSKDMSNDFKAKSQRMDSSSHSEQNEERKSNYIGKGRGNRNQSNSSSRGGKDSSKQNHRAKASPNTKRGRNQNGSHTRRGQSPRSKQFSGQQKSSGKRAEVKQIYVAKKAQPSNDSSSTNNAAGTSSNQTPSTH